MANDWFIRAMAVAVTGTVIYATGEHLGWHNEVLDLHEPVTPYFLWSSPPSWVAVYSSYTSLYPPAVTF